MIVVRSMVNLTIDTLVLGSTFFQMKDSVSLRVTIRLALDVDQTSLLGLFTDDFSMQCLVQDFS